MAGRVADPAVGVFGVVVQAALDERAGGDDGREMALSATLDCSPAWMVRVAKLRGLSDMVGSIA